MRLSKTMLSCAASLVASIATVPASAVTITTDFSSLGSVYQNSSGVLFTSAGAGLTDVTNIFKADVATGVSYLSSAILLPWSTTISFQLADLASENAVGDSLITGTDADGRASTSTIRVDTGNLGMFLDPTPGANSEFAMTTANASLGGGSVNVSRFGQSMTGGPADGLWDLVTLVVHETEHSLGFSDNLQRFVDLVGSSVSDPNAPDRQLTIPTFLSGLPSSYQVPIVPTSAHIDGVVDGGIFNNTVVAQPGFDVGQRALPTDLEIESICVVNGCTSASDMNLPGTVAAVPEASDLAMMLGGMPLLIAAVSRRRKRVQPQG